MRPRIVVSLLTSEQEFQLMQAADARSVAQRAGFDIEVVFADNNAIQQIHQLYEFVNAKEGQRPAAIIVEAVSTVGMERLARNALKAGIRWVVQQWKTGYVEAIRREFPNHQVFSVAVDEEEIGRIQSLQCKALLPEGGAVLFIHGPQDSVSAKYRFQGLEQGIKGSHINLKWIFNGDWTAKSAQQALMSWLHLKTTECAQIDLVGAQNDSMAMGARQAILDVKKELASLHFIGCDGLPEGGQKLVAEMKLTATVVKPTTTGQSIELIAQVLRGQRTSLDLVLPPRSYPPLEELARR
jgi:ABC-type sugar transport system substrate-binding protein